MCESTFVKQFHFKANEFPEQKDYTTRPIYKGSRLYSRELAVLPNAEATILLHINEPSHILHLLMVSVGTVSAEDATFSQPSENS
jgi:hypothetical protein